MMRKELKRAREREKYMKKERNMLLANISHDLKTPITSIKGYVEGIQDGIADTPKKMKRYLDTIHTKAEVIDDLVNNLSVFSKLELSRLTFEFKEGDINSFMRDFVDDYRLDLEKNGIKLETDIPTDEVIVRMDYEKMHSECDAIIMDHGCVTASPQLTANNIDANLIHEAAIGKIAGEQLIKLMTLGLTEKEAEEQIINGFLK